MHIARKNVKIIKYKIIFRQMDDKIIGENSKKYYKTNKYKLPKKNNSIKNKITIIHLNRH